MQYIGKLKRNRYYRTLIIFTIPPLTGHPMAFQIRFSILDTCRKSVRYGSL